MTWLSFVSEPFYAHVLVEKALRAELVLMGDLAITICVLPVFLLPATILAKNDLFSEQFNVIKLYACLLLQGLHIWVLAAVFPPVESRAMGLSPPRHPVLHTSSSSTRKK